MVNLLSARRRSAMMRAMHYNQATFVTSAANLAACPPESRAEVAFAGRSNAGKSSAILAGLSMVKLSGAGAGLLSDRVICALLPGNPAKSMACSVFVVSAARAITDPPASSRVPVTSTACMACRHSLAR